MGDKMNLARLRQIAQYQHETGCRVEYEARTILALLDHIEADDRRKEFLRENFAGGRWSDEEIDSSIADRHEKGLD